MAITEAFAGSETVGATEHSLTTDTAGPDADTTDGIYQAFVDLNALANGDLFELRLYERVLSGSTQRLAWRCALANAQAEPVFVSPSFILLHGWDFTLVKVSGTDRAIDWSIRRVA